MIYTKTILSSLKNVLKTIDIPNFDNKFHGKVRDFYIQGDKRILITTDRQSAFDSVVGYVPFKGSVLNLLSSFWFKQTKNIITNHMIAIPHPNVLIAKNCQPIPIEMIVRGYISGVTKTSIWYSYKQGERNIYGINFPDGLNKNQQLPVPIITPTTHGSGPNGHDERLTREEIIKQKIVPKVIYEEMEKASLALFKLGSQHCQKNGLILVDTKYEFGLYKGKLTLIDEIHTPDSSRFWLAKSYQKRFKRGLEPENFDKEFLRLWYANQGYLGEGKPPSMSPELTVAVAKRYIKVYEIISGQKFEGYKYPITNKIIKAVLNYEKKKNYL